LDRDVAQRLPAIQAAATFTAPIEWLLFGVFDNGGITIIPLEAKSALDIGLGRWVDSR
jgi:hypothetical protein